MRYLEQERTPGALAAMTQGLQELWSLVYHASELKTQFEVHCRVVSKFLTTMLNEVTPKL